MHVQPWYLGVAAFETAVGRSQEKLLSCLDHRAKVLSSNPGSAQVCVREYTLALEVWGLGREQHCRRVCCSPDPLWMLMVPVVQQMANLWLSRNGEYGMSET